MTVLQTVALPLGYEAIRANLGNAIGRKDTSQLLKVRESWPLNLNP
jgi:hypothetical protein